MKPGDRIIWLHSPGRSFLTGWRLERTPGVIERIYRSRVRIRVQMGGREKVVNVRLDNIVSAEDG